MPKSYTQKSKFPASYSYFCGDRFEYFVLHDNKGVIIIQPEATSQVFKALLPLRLSLPLSFSSPVQRRLTDQTSLE